MRSTAPRFSATTLSALRPSSSAAIFVRQQFGEDCLECVRVAHLHRRILCQEAPGHVRKILHVRPEHHRLAQRARLNRILSADRPSGSCRRTPRWPARKKTSARRSCSPAGIRPRPGPGWFCRKISLRQKNFTPRARSFCPTSRQRSKCRGTSIRNSFGNCARSRCAISARMISSPSCVLPATRIGRIRRHAQLAQHRRAHPASAVPPAWPRRISGCPPRGPLPGGSRLRAAAPRPLHSGSRRRRTTANSGRNRKRKFFIARKRAVGQPRIGQENRDAKSLRAPEEIRPDFRLDQHDGLGIDRRHARG